MSLLKTSLALLALSAKITTAQFTQDGQEDRYEHSRCANQCIWDAWPDGYCVGDLACMCNEEDKREAYVCCVVDKCETGEWKDALENASSGCIAKGIPFSFDVEEACATTPDSTSISTSVIGSGTATVTETSTASASATETATATETEMETTDADETEPTSATASPTETQTDEDSEETSDPPNRAAGREAPWAGVAVVAVGAGILL